MAREGLALHEINMNLECCLPLVELCASVTDRFPNLMDRFPHVMGEGVDLVGLLGDAPRGHG